jgi:16S rRNA (cytosine967-C5)-methyltransferase
VLDLCAGAGGKTLAISAALANRGQVFAHEPDRARLAPIHERLRRAGVRNVQVLPVRGDPLDRLKASFDCVVVDAPCSGTGVWRRRPEAKWRLTSAALAKRVAEQRAILTEALTMAKPGGRLVYITCSLLSEENVEQIRWLLSTNPNLAPVAIDEPAQRVMGESWRKKMDADGPSLTLRPSRTGTDGFFVSVLRSL